MGCHVVSVKRTTNGTDVGLRVQYAYDAFGVRVKKIVDSDGDGTAVAITTLFAIDGWNPPKVAPVGLENVDVYADLDANGSLKTQYLRGEVADQLLGRIDYPSGAASPGNIFWNPTDHLGSIREIIDNTGAVRDAIGYDAFGRITSETNAAERERYALEVP